MSPKAIACIALFGIPAICYLLQGGNYGLNQRYGMTLAMASYCVANVGLILDFFGI